MSTPTFFIVDALNILFRAHFALPEMINANQQQTQALFGFIRSLKKLEQSSAVRWGVVVFDGEDNKKSRRSVYPAYKAHRPPMAPELLQQLVWAQEYCALAGWKILQIPLVEADDVIASIVTQVDSHGAPVAIVSSDKDLCQLVQEGVSILQPHKNMEPLDAAGVYERFGVRPGQIKDYLALVGDVSDNIPGLSGCGKKTATKWLSKWGDLETILAHTELLTPKERRLLQEGLHSARLSQTLVALQRDVVIPRAVDAYIKEPDNAPEMSRFYQQFNFNSLKSELAIKGEESSINPPAPIEIGDLESWQKWIKSLPTCVAIAPHVEGIQPIEIKVKSWLFFDKIQGLIKITPSSWKSEASCLALLAKLFSPKSPVKKWLAIDGKLLFHATSTAHIEPFPICFDALIASALRQQATCADYKPEDSLLHGEEALAGKLRQLPSQYEAWIADEEMRGIHHYFKEVELPLTAVLAQIEETGMYLNCDYLEKIKSSVEEEIFQVKELIFDMAQARFNLNSPKQLGIVLFQKLKLKGRKKTTMGFSTNASILQQIEAEHPIIPLVILYRALEKIRSSYLETLPTHKNAKTGRIHCLFRQCGASTGRLSCYAPNLQTIPMKSDRWRTIRYAFSTEKENSVLISADFSQIELRFLAHLSQDPTLIEAFKQDEDIHKATAATLFGVPLEEVTSGMRREAKAVNFGIIYGQTAFGLAKSLNISVETAAQFIRAYLEKYPAIARYINYAKEEARQRLFVQTPSGRKRFIGESIISKRPQERTHAESIAINSPLQGAAAELMKKSLIAAHQLLKENPFYQAKIVLHIHDELLIECDASLAPILANQIKSLLENLETLSVPLVVNVSIGKNWGEC